MQIFINNQSINEQIVQCVDREEVGLLYESVVCYELIGEETQQHRQELNQRLLDAMLAVFSNDTQDETVSFYYTTK